ncbi:MAG TPA: glutamate--tRNA ligase family protein [Vicinamibacterales bacterium]|nr:glutamate--tRNA ligase family protein [Vicinamibacterales bacterium]
MAAWVAARAERPLLTRFAPAPTGHLHLGHVVNAIYVWGLTRAVGGRVLLRIEDHDRQRSRPELERSLLDDLDWLGFAADVYPSGCYRRGACDGRQSERDAIYRATLAPLIDAGLIYGCRCSRTDLADARSSSNGERRYPGTCRDAGLLLDAAVSWRLKLDPGVETFDDGVLGAQAQDPAAQCGDLLLRDRLGNWTYQCAATIDDCVQDVTLVVRGEDILPSTGRQIRLACLIGRRTPPLFVHHPLIMKSTTHKLSKSDGDTGIADLRRAGWAAADIIGYAACLVRLTPERAPLEARDVATLFQH